ncbi:MAG TPA: TRAFs-binding domain-containing protein [Desulfosporosinus sp.]|nr:TRAFs-binding domain-containing protein [Desulfosporosinus sp.]
MENSVLLDGINDLYPHLDRQEPTLSSIITEARKAMERDDFIHAKSLLHVALTLDKSNSFVIQRLVLATYKAKLPSHLEALKEALMILKVLKPKTSTDPETLGLAGAIYKRLWEKQGNRLDLDQAIVYYEKGFRIENDYYNGINAAYLLNVRASISSQNEAANDHIKAQRVRRKVIWNCMQCWSDQYWIRATLEEVYFGLGYYEDYQKLKKHSIGPSNGNWERETTQSQIHKLGELIAFKIN